MQKPIIEIPAAGKATIEELIAKGILIMTDKGLKVRE